MFTFTAIGDSNPTYACGTFLEVICNNATTATIALSGFASPATITETIIVFDHPVLSRLGLASLTKRQDIFAVGSPLFATSDLVSPLGPITTDLAEFGPVSAAISTSAGDLEFFGVPGPSPIVTFTATAAVPEPSTLLLTALAGSALCIGARRVRPPRPTAPWRPAARER